MKNSIEKRFILIGMSMTGGFIILNIILTYLFLIPFSVKISFNQLNKVAVDLKKQNINDKEQMESYITQVEDDMNIKISIVDHEGVIVFTNMNNNKLGEQLNQKSTSSKLLFNNLNKLDEGKTVSSTRETENDNLKAIRLFLVKKVGDDRYAILSRSYRSLENAMKSSIVFELISGCVLLILGSIIVWRWSLFFVKPIREITETAEHISDLEFDNKVEVKSFDELGQLAIAINKMSDHLQDNVEQFQEDIESRKRLVRNLSHEIKSPIAVIMGYADRMKAVISNNPEKAVQYSEIISDESNRVDILVKEMLELSRMEQNYDGLRTEKISAKRLFGDIKKRFHQEYMDRDIIYEDKYNSDDIIFADYILVERAVYNLIRNAVTYVTGNQAIIRIEGCLKDDYYVVSVYNSGSSVPEEDRKSIWEPFSKVDKARSRGKKGFGVGLAIVREIVIRHEGYYGVENTDDGVTFTISFKQDIAK